MDKRICLCMIVKNEAHVIGRALRSVREHVDSWVICDTGSTDGTPALVLQAMAGVPGELHSVPWVDFASNRTTAVRLAAGRADYILMMDADMTACVHAPFKHKLWADAHDIRYEGDTDYSQPMLLADRHDWTYVGVVHEYVRADTAKSFAPLPELTLAHGGDGGMRAEKFERDIRLLTGSLARDPGDSRAMFYLAQSYRDVGEYALALDWYRRRAAATGWEEEGWYALYQAARMRDLLGEDWPLVQAAYLEAYERRPTRFEPLFWLAQHCRSTERFALGLLFAAPAGPRPAYPDDRLFIDRPIYEHLLPLEYGICAYGSGRPREAAAAFETVLSAPRAPDWVREAGARGMEMAQADLPAPAPALA